MTPAQLSEYDRLLDENDWDIYYWATQREATLLSTTSGGSGADAASSAAGSPRDADADALATDRVQAQDEIKRQPPPQGEWPQTAGNFKPAYRPVPSRWRDSQILDMLRTHVKRRSVNGGQGQGMAFMPDLDERP